MRQRISPETVGTGIDALASGVGIEKRATIACGALVKISS